MASIGKFNTLTVIRRSVHGVYLDGEELGDILLPRKYVDRGLEIGDPISVFVYGDSEDRLVATTERPLAVVGDFALLEVIAINPNVGAFLNWGLERDLLLPFREWLGNLRVGMKVVVAVYLDARSQRISTSMRVAKHCIPGPPPYHPGQAVSLLIAENTSLGYRAVIENAYEGLLYHDNLTKPLEIGARIKGYIQWIRPDGKVDLTLEASNFERVEEVQDKIVDALRRNGGRFYFDDDSSAESIRQKFGVSKNAFKQALGALYKRRRIKLLKPGVQLMETEDWKPGEVDVPGPKGGPQNG